MTFRQESYELEHILTDAALQALFMRAHRNDLSEKSEGIRFVYGVDANVVRAWGNPHYNSNRRFRIGRIFQSDEEDLATAISWGLLSFIFNKLGPDGIPLAILPPIDIELLAIVEALNLESLDDSKRFGISKAIDTRISEVENQLRDAHTPSELAEFNIKLQELLLEEVGPFAELKRINLLFTRSQIAPLEEILHRLPQAIREVLMPSTDRLGQWWGISEAIAGTRGWKERLSRAGKWEPETLMDHDAQVLGRIEVWNRTLVEKNLPWRVLYLTADRRLFRAAALYHVPWQEGRDFAEAFLRHPHAYLSEDGVLGPVESTNNESEQSGVRESVGDWLAMLTQPARPKLGELLDTGTFASGIPQTIQRFAQKMALEREGCGSTKSHIEKEINDKWRNFAIGALVTHPVSGNSLDGLTRDYLRKADDLIKVVRDEYEQLERNRRRFLRDYLQVTTKLGRWFEAETTKQPIIRPVAPVFFEDWREAGEAIALMSRWSNTSIDDTRYQNAVDLIEQNDTTAYAFYLAHATFFAARGRWQAAALVARRARRIGENFRSKTGFDKNARGAHGREAAYFEATCLRQLARKREDLADARICLQKASRILDEEKDIGTYSEFIEERFIIESAMIDFYDYLFVALVEERGKKYTEYFRSIVDKLWPIAVNLGDMLANVDVVNARKLGDVTETRLRVELQLLISIVSFSFLPDANESDRSRSHESLKRLEYRFTNAHIEEIDLSESERVILLAARMRSQPRHVDKATRKLFDDSKRTIENSKDQRQYDRPLLTLLLVQ